MDSVEEHRREAPRSVGVGILTISTSRYESRIGKEGDVSGGVIRDSALRHHHRVVEWKIVPDDVEKIRISLSEMLNNPEIDAIITTGGTGLGGGDVTIEAIRKGFEKELVNFGPIFAMLSYQDIGPAGILSRAVAGVMKGKPVFCLPGSPKACELASEKIIMPELSHVVKHARE